MTKVVKNNGGNSRLAWGVNRSINSIASAFAEAKRVRAARNQKRHDAAAVRRRAIGGGAKTIAAWFIAGISNRVKAALEAMGYPIKKSMAGFKLDLQLFAAAEKTDYPFFSERDRLVFMGDGSRVRNGAFWEATKAERENAREEWRNAMLSGIGSRIRGSAMVVAVDDCYEQAITRDDLMAGVFSRTKAKAMKVAIDAEYDATREERCQKRMLQLLKRELRRRKFEDRYQVSDFDGDWMARRKEAITAGKVVVDSEKEFLAIRRHLLKKEGKQFSITCLAQGEETAYPMAVSVPVGAETPLMERTVSSAYVRINPLAYGEIERFSYAYLDFKIQNTMGLAVLLKRRIFRLIEMVDGTVVREEFFTDSLVPFTREDGTEEPGLRNMLTGEIKSASWLLAEDGSLKSGKNWYCLLYTAEAAVSTNGQEKQGAVTLSCQNLEEWNAWEHHNRMMQGAPEELVRYFGGRELAVKELAQLATRDAQFKAPARDLKGLPGICVVLGKVKDDLGNEYEDGYLRISAEYLADAFTDDDYIIMPWAVDGQTAQVRPQRVCKGLGLIQPQRYIRQWLDEHHVLVRVIAQDELHDREEQDALNEALIDKKGAYMLTDEEKARGYQYAAVLVVPSREELTDEELLRKAAVLADLNVCKTTFSLAMPLTGLVVLDLSHGKMSLEEEANTSNQLLQSAVVADPYATKKLFVKRAKKRFDELMDDQLMSEGRAPHASELMADLSLAAAVVNPDFVREVWAPYFQDTLNKRVDGWANRLARMSVATDGIYVKIIPDVAHEIGVNLLGFDSETGRCEIFAPMLEKMGVEKAVGVKYPKMGFDEYGKFVNVTVEELLRRIDAFFETGKITDVQKARLIHLVKAFKTGSVMVPAIEELKNMLAGMDFDGDALILYTDEELVDIIWQVKPVAVVIMDDDEYEAAKKADREAVEENKEVKTLMA